MSFCTKAGLLVIFFSMIEITRGSVSMTSSCSVSNLLKSFALLTSSLSRSQPFGLLCLQLALLFSPAVGQAPSVLSTMSPERRCTSRCPLALVASFSLFTTCSLDVVQSLFSPESPCASLRLRGSPRASPTPLLSLRHFVIIGSR